EFEGHEQRGRQRLSFCPRPIAAEMSSRLLARDQAIFPAHSRRNHTRSVGFPWQHQAYALLASRSLPGTPVTTESHDGATPESADHWRWHRWTLSGPRLEEGRRRR